MSENSNILTPIRNAVGFASSNAMMTKLGLTAEYIVQTRTDMGIDVHQVPFKPYSTKYKELRQKMGLPTNRVDLIVDDVTGMRKSLESKTLPGKVLVYTKGSRNRRISRYHNIMGAGKSKVIRKYMGLHKDEWKQIIELFGEEFANKLRGLSHGSN